MLLGLLATWPWFAVGLPGIDLLFTAGVIFFAAGFLIFSLIAAIYEKKEKLVAEGMMVVAAALLTTAIYFEWRRTLFLWCGALLLLASGVLFTIRALRGVRQDETEDGP